jgi:hypothetical protein
LGTAKPILRVLRGQLQCRRPGFLAKHTSQRFRCKGALAIGELHHRLFTPDGCALGLYLEYSGQRRPNGARRNGLAVVRLRAALRPGNSKEQLHIRRWQLAPSQLSFGPHSEFLLALRSRTDGSPKRFKGRGSGLLVV